MDIKSATTVAMLLGAMVFGGVFVTMTQEGHLLMGLAGGGLVGVVSGLMALGVMSNFVQKDSGDLVTPPERPVSEKSVIDMLVPTFLALGVDPAQARKSAKDIFDEEKESLLSRAPGLDIYKTTQGTAYVGDQAFMAPRLLAGLSASDVEAFWNRPLIMVFCEMKLREMLSFINLDVARQQGQDLDAAALRYKRVNPQYGDPTQWNSSLPGNKDLRECDTDIYLELATRVNSWRSKTPDSEVDRLVAEHGTFNAMVRELVSKGLL